MIKLGSAHSVPAGGAGVGAGACIVSSSTDSIRDITPFESDFPEVFIPANKCKEVLLRITPFFKVECIGTVKEKGYIIRIHATRKELEKEPFFSFILKSCKMLPGKDTKAVIAAHAAKVREEFAARTVRPFVELPDSLLPEGYDKEKKEPVVERITESARCLEQEKNMIEKLLGSYPGICIGDDLKDDSPKLFIRNHMQTLYDSGVRIFYAGYVRFDTHAELFEEYNDLPKESPMPPVLESYLKKMDSYNGLHLSSSLFELFKAVHQAGMKIVPIGSERSSCYYDKDVPLEKTLQMNSDALIAIESTLKEGEKYVVYCEQNQLVQPLTYKAVAEPGLAQILGIPAISVKDTKRELLASTSAVITLNYREKFTESTIVKPPSVGDDYFCHVMIERPALFGIGELSAFEQEMWDIWRIESTAYNQKYNESKKVHESVSKEPFKTSAELQEYCLGRMRYLEPLLSRLYKEAPKSYVTKRLRYFYLDFLKWHVKKMAVSIEGVSEIRATKMKMWPAVHWFADGVFCIEHAESICKVLRKGAPEAIDFDERPTSDYIYGGVCSTLCIEFLIEFQHRARFVDLSDPGCFDYITNHFNCIIPGAEEDYKRDTPTRRSIQAALNTLTKPRSAKGVGDSSENIEAIMQLAGAKVIASSGIYDLVKDTEEDIANAIKTFRDGCSIIRAVLPEDSPKKESHGHTMVMIKKGDAIAFFDPNFGVKVFNGGLDEASKEIIRTIKETDLIFNIPKMQIHLLDFVPKIPSSLYAFDLIQEPLCFTKKQIETLSNESAYYVLKYFKQVNSLMEVGVSFERLATAPITTLPQLLSHASTVILLIQQGKTIEEIIGMIETYPVFFDEICACHKKKGLEIILKQFSIEELLGYTKEQRRLLLECFNSTTILKEMGLSIEEITTGPVAELLMHSKKYDENLSKLLKNGITIEVLLGLDKELLSRLLASPDDVIEWVKKGNHIAGFSPEK